MEEQDIIPFKHTHESNAQSKSNAKSILQDLSLYKRPIIMGGHGVKLSGAEKLFKSFVERYNIPTVLSWSAVDLLEEDHKSNYGRSGVQGQRSANFIVQNCDLMIVLGSRLSLLQTGYSRSDFAPNAKIIHVDIDKLETDKFTDYHTINEDVHNLLVDLLSESIVGMDIKDWIGYCDNVREKFPRVMPEHLSDPTNSYTFIDTFSKKLSDNYTIVTDMGTALLSGFYGFNIKPNQKEKDLIAEIERCQIAIEANIRDFKFREALFELMNMARAGNKYLADNEPWKTVKTDADHTATIMFHAIQVCAHLSWWMNPFIPFSASKLCEILNFNKDNYTFGNFEQVPVKHQLGEAIHLFSNIEDDVIQVQLDKLMATKNAIASAETLNKSEKKDAEAAKASIQFDDFSKMDLRVGTILSAEKVKKADKLLMLQVDLGFETRTIVSGIALHFETETLIGKQVCVLANLEARTIKGIESKGMILMAEDADGKLHLMSPDSIINPGASIA